MYGTLKVHPFADKFPLIEGTELDELAEDIKVNGLREAILVSNDGTTIIDGRNRYRACEVAGVEPKIKPLAKTVKESDVIELIMSVNVQRRHLSQSQRAVLGTEYLEFTAKIAAEAKLAGQKKGAATTNAKANGNGDGDESDGTQADGDKPKRKRGVRATDQAGKLVGTSGRSVARAARVKAVDPDLADDVLKGTVTLAGAEDKVRRATGGGAKRKPRVATDRSEKPLEARALYELNARIGGLARFIEDHNGLGASVTSAIAGEAVFGQNMRALRVALRDFQQEISERAAEGSESKTDDGQPTGTDDQPTGTEPTGDENPEITTA